MASDLRKFTGNETVLTETDSYDTKISDTRENSAFQVEKLNKVV